MNEYLAIDSGGHVSDLAVARNCSISRMLPGEAGLVSEWTGLPGDAKSVKRFERCNGPDTALYKNYLYLYYINLRRSRDCSRQVLSFAFLSSFPSPNYPITLHNESVHCQYNESVHCQYNESVHWKEQLATRINTIAWTNFAFIHFYFCETTDSMHYLSPTERTSGSFEHKPVRSPWLLFLNGNTGL